MARRLSKSRIIAGLQCPRRLWLQVNRPELVVLNPGDERRFAIGHEVGEVARDIQPGGQLIEHDDDLGRAISETRQLMATGEALLFEATFEYEGVLIRADILRADETGCDITEIKSSTSVKDYHLLDCAVQAWVLEGAGYPVNSASVGYINNQFVYQGDGGYEGLITCEDVSSAIDELKATLPEQVVELKAVMEGDMPCVAPGAQCHDPFDCPFTGFCSPDTTEYPVTLLPRGKRVAESLLAEGIEDIRDIPEGYLENDRFERVRRATVKGRYELDAALSHMVRTLEWPRFYLDFETITFAVPIWKDTRPYEQLTFQWSCHVEQSPGVLAHGEYLDTTGASPMRAFTESLLAFLGETGPIIVYSSFEATQLKALAMRFPDLEDKLKGVIERLVDLLPPTRAHYYHPAMKGSYSIKAVLPTVAPDLDYSQLDAVHDGTEAQIAYLEMVDVGSPQERKTELKEALLEYCKLDTFAMVRLVDFFANSGGVHVSQS